MRALPPRFLLAGLLGFSVLGCTTRSSAPAEAPPLDEVRPPEGFTFSTTRAVRVEVPAALVAGAAVQVQDPFGRVLVERPADAQGDLSFRFAVPRDVEALTLVTRRGETERRRALPIAQDGRAQPGAED